MSYLEPQKISTHTDQAQLAAQAAEKKRQPIVPSNANLSQSFKSDMSSQSDRGLPQGHRQSLLSENFLAAEKRRASNGSDLSLSFKSDVSLSQSDRGVTQSRRQSLLSEVDCEWIPQSRRQSLLSEDFLESSRAEVRSPSAREIVIPGKAAERQRQKLVRHKSAVQVLQDSIGEKQAMERRMVSSRNNEDFLEPRRMSDFKREEPVSQAAREVVAPGAAGGMTSNPEKMVIRKTSSISTASRTETPSPVGVMDFEPTTVGVQKREKVEESRRRAQVRERVTAW